MRIGIDLMGSDHSPHALFDAVIQAAKQYPDLSFSVFSSAETAAVLSDFHRQLMSVGQIAKVDFVLSDQVITMRDDPMTALRKKKNSSLVQGVKAVKAGEIDALISAGNTGALMAASTLSLPLLPGIRRPGLLALLPTEKSPLAVLDVGSSLVCNAEHFSGYAKVGSAYLRVCHEIVLPKVSLLNVGAESKKGTEEHRKAYQLLQERAGVDQYDFTGNVEARDVFRGNIDLLVTDGFTGNVLLKTGEGVAFFILDFLRKSAITSPSGHLQHLLQELQSHFSYAEYPGAILLGVEGVVIKCHGDSSSKGLFNAIKGAIHSVERNLIPKLKKELEAPASK